MKTIPSIILALCLICFSSVQAENKISEIEYADTMMIDVIRTCQN